MLDLKDIFPKNIIVIGVGGGGSRVARDVLVPFLFEAYNKGFTSAMFGDNSTKVLLVDHDIVEYRNCYRQDFLPYEAGRPKVDAIHKRLRGIINTVPIPEAVNIYTLPLIFTKEILEQPFAVISNLDHAISTSQVYNYILENTPKETSWSWYFGGTSTVVQKIKGTYREMETFFKSPYVTNYMYGSINGQPIIPEPSDPRFLKLAEKPLPPHYGHADILPNVTGVTGRQSDGGGCGLDAGDMVEQVSAGNQLATVNTNIQLSNYYFNGVVLPEIVYLDGQSTTSLPYSIEEILAPTANPGLVENLTTATATETES